MTAGRKIKSVIVLTDLVNLYLKLDEVNEAEKYCFYLLDGAKYSNSFRYLSFSLSSSAFVLE